MAAATTREHRGSHQIDMLNGPLLKGIVLFALPLAFTSILQQLFNAADSAVAGQLINENALAAVGANAPVISLMINLFVGISVGANVVIATFIGRAQPDRVRDAVHTTVAIALVSGLLLIVVGQLAARPLLVLIDTPDDVIDLAETYLRVYFAGMPFNMLYNFVSAILRSKGDTARPLLSLVIGCGLNALLDLAFVGWCGWGVAGVALATVIAYAAAAAYLVGVLLHEEGPFRLELRRLVPDGAIVKNILKIGVPAGIQGMVFSLSNLCIQSAINGFGPAATAGTAASLNFELFGYYMVGASGQATVTFISQNYAVRNYDRCRRIFRLCLAVGLLSSMTLCLVFAAFREPLIGLYTTDPASIAMGSRRMLFVTMFAFTQFGYEMPGGVMRGTGRSMLPATITIVGTCVLRFVWVYTIFAAHPTYETLLLVYPVSWIVTGASMYAAYRWICGHELYGRGRAGAQVG